MTETRHGVEEVSDTISQQERDELLKREQMMSERYRWEGDDWPRPNPGLNPKKLAIVGYAPSKLIVPFGEEGWEFWGLNDPTEGPGQPSRHSFTRWFQIHPPRYLVKHYPKGLMDLADAWGKSRDIRLYMDRHYPEYPDSEPYPKDEVEALTNFGWYHASSFDWMVALGILEGFEVIELYGASFYTFPVFNTEPITALACLQYWLGVAEGRGIKVNVFGGGHLFTIQHLAVYNSKLKYGWDREPGLDLNTDVDARWKDVR